MGQVNFFRRCIWLRKVPNHHHIAEETAQVQIVTVNGARRTQLDNIQIMQIIHNKIRNIRIPPPHFAKLVFSEIACYAKTHEILHPLVDRFKISCVLCMPVAPGFILLSVRSFICLFLFYLLIYCDVHPMGLSQPSPWHIIRYQIQPFINLRHHPDYLHGPGP